MKRSLALFVVALAGFLAGGLVAMPSAQATTSIGLCSSSSAPCVVEFTVNGTDVFSPGGVTYDPVYGAMASTPSAAVGDTVTLTLDLGPVGSTTPYYTMLTSGNAQSFSIDVSGSEVIVSYTIIASTTSWMNQTPGHTCMIGDCPNDLVADFDGVGTITQVMPLTSDERSGSWVSTNAQATRLLSDTGEFSFEVASPHFMADATTVSPGFFKIYLPRTTLTQLLNAPDVTASTFAQALTLTDSLLGGATTNLTDSAVVTDVGGGLLISQPSFTYSTHTIALVPDAPAPGQEWIVRRQAVPLPSSGLCADVADAPYAYGTGLTGGWQRGWEPWIDSGREDVLGGWACIRALVNKGGQAWSVDSSAL